MSDQPDEETDDPLIANDRNYFKVEKWTKDGSKVDRMLYAGNSLLRAESVFGGNQASAAHQADHPATVSRAAAVALGQLRTMGSASIARYSKSLMAWLGIITPPPAGAACGWAVQIPGRFFNRLVTRAEGTGRLAASRRILRSGFGARKTYGGR
jgi:hypothetical protein